jgi:hypothetical protein
VDIPCLDAVEVIHEAKGLCVQNEVDKRVSQVCTCLEIHRKIEELIFVSKSLFVQELKRILS